MFCSVCFQIQVPQQKKVAKEKDKYQDQHIHNTQKEKQAKEKGSANRKKKVAKEKEISQNIYTSHDHQKENKQRKRGMAILICF